MEMELEETLDSLREKGNRITLPRRWTLKVLLQEQTHLTCEQVQAHLAEQDMRINTASVYRALQWLKQNGIVAQTDLGTGAAVYSLIGSRPHHHLVCLNCDEIIDAPDDLFDTLRERLLRDYHFQARIDHFAIFGLCDHCQDEDSE
jgi:Fur family ferric uptake transcriptional regulator